ncbi:MAG: hypothetical protein IJV31_01530 [Clostridia bacterium]|nr:hypothetical protein [Clostridia bacterium]
MLILGNRILRIRKDMLLKVLVMLIKSGKQMLMVILVGELTLILGMLYLLHKQAMLLKLLMIFINFFVEMQLGLI